MKFSCAMPERRFGVIGLAFTALSVNQPEFLPIGLALLVMAATQYWRACRRS
ncbi:hypothetical protein HPT27_02055 [Permianibacter sp. IMCC34836]|uniref:hypothetical protein n=1 Tax=Permianibacter fluminis TaxID=2738515 RepID=UPI00155590A7|nr:hypothetical protein [Permianibacter fluminis]NQD35786.1 hypothetical protein [Permianibacter fluminis]